MRALFILTLLVAVSSSAESVVVKDGTELCTVLEKMGEQGEAQIEISQPAKLSAKLELTSQGNGTLEVANLRLRIFDDHDDGKLFEPRCLGITLDEQGLQLRGAVVTTEGKSRRRTLNRKYKFDQKTRTFKVPSPKDRDVDL